MDHPPSDYTPVGVYPDAHSGVWRMFGDAAVVSRPVPLPGAGPARVAGHVAGHVAGQEAGA